MHANAVSCIATKAQHMRMCQAPSNLRYNLTVVAAIDPDKVYILTVSRHGTQRRQGADLHFLPCHVLPNAALPVPNVHGSSA